MINPRQFQLQLMWPVPKLRPSEIWPHLGQKYPNEVGKGTPIIAECFISGGYLSKHQLSNLNVSQGSDHEQNTWSADTKPKRIRRDEKEARGKYGYSKGNS